MRVMLADIVCGPLRRLRDSYSIHYTDNPIKTLFYTIMLISIAVILIGGILTGGEAIKNLLLQVNRAAGYDFFQCLRINMNMGKDIYPPFAQMLYYLMGMLVIPSAGGVPSTEYRETQMGFLIYTMYVLIVYFLLYRAISRMKIGTEREKQFLFILLMFTIPSIFLFERANIMILSVVFTLLFFNGYDSENKKVRYASYLCLAIATGIKIYPVIFGVILLRWGITRNMKEIGICVMTGLAVFFIPFLFSNGSVSQLFNNMFSHSSKMSTRPHADYVNLDNFTKCIYGFFESVPPEALFKTVSVVLMAAALFAVIFSVKADRWKPIALTISMVILLTGFKPLYALLFMIAPLILFIDSRPALSKLSLVYLICFMLMFMPMFEIFFDLNGDHPIPISLLIESSSLLAMFILLICEMLPDAVKNATDRIKNRRSCTDGIASE